MWGDSGHFGRGAGLPVRLCVARFRLGKKRLFQPTVSGCQAYVPMHAFWEGRT